MAQDGGQRQIADTEDSGAGEDEGGVNSAGRETAAVAAVSWLEQSDSVCWTEVGIIPINEVDNEL